jgi:hypothetical protein
MRECRGTDSRALALISGQWELPSGDRGAKRALYLALAVGRALRNTMSGELIHLDLEKTPLA